MCCQAITVFTYIHNSLYIFFINDIYPQSLVSQFVNWMFLANYMKRKHILLSFQQLKCHMRHTMEPMSDLGRLPFLSWKDVQATNWWKTLILRFIICFVSFFLISCIFAICSKVLTFGQFLRHFTPRFISCLFFR